MRQIGAVMDGTVSSNEHSGLELPDRCAVTLSKTRNLNLCEKIFLLALLRSTGYGENASFRYLIESSVPWAPCEAYSGFMISALTRRGILVPSGPENAIIRIKTSPMCRDVMGIRGWKLDPNIDWPNLTLLSDEIRYEERHQAHVDDLLSMWQELSVAEAIGHLAYQLSQMKFDSSLAEAAGPAFFELSTSWAISELYFLSWVVSRDFAAWQAREMTREPAVQHAAICAMATSKSKVLSRNKTIKSFPRSQWLYESSVSHSFAHIALHLGDRFIKLPPSEELVLSFDPEGSA